MCTQFKSKIQTTQKGWRVGGFLKVEKHFSLNLKNNNVGESGKF
jgi:hypothetical protein